MAPERPSRPETAAPTLTLSYDHGTGPRVEKTFAQPFRIGRDPQCEVCIEEGYISRVHATVVYENGGWWIFDEHSTNGTFIQGRRVVRERLTPGTLVQLGVDGVVMTFEYGETKPVASPAPRQAPVLPVAPQEPRPRQAPPPPPYEEIEVRWEPEKDRTPSPPKPPPIVEALPVVAPPPPSRPYRTSSFSLQIPADWKDLTAHFLTGPATDGIQPNITVHRSPLSRPTSLDDFVEEQVDSLRTLKDCRILRQRPVMLEVGLEASCVIFCWNPSDDLHLYQEQVYVLHEGTGYTLTASFTRRTRKLYGKAVERALLSFCPAPTPESKQGQGR